MKSCVQIVYAFIIGGLLISCSVKRNVSTDNNVQKTDTLVGRSIKSVQFQIEQNLIQPEDDYNKCFSIENGYEDFVYTDTLITKTDKGNFFKKVSITDSKFVWSCGRGDIEKVIDTLPCTDVVESLIDWETEEFIGLLKPCGSYCWTNIIIPISSSEPFIYLSYSAIDFEKMNAVSVIDNYFLITNLKTHKKVKVPIDKIECVDNFSLFAVENIKLEAESLYFSVKCKGGSSIDRKKKISLIDLLD